MHYSLCLRMAPLICLGACVIALWGCAAHPSRAGHAGRRTVADLLRPQDPGTPPAPPETPTDEDWQVWTTIRARWPEVEQLLADRQALRNTPPETPGRTQQQTYVFDSRHVALIEAYAHAHGLELQEVMYAICEEFFQHHGYLQGRRQPP